MKRMKLSTGAIYFIMGLYITLLAVLGILLIIILME